MSELECSTAGCSGEPTTIYAALLLCSECLDLAWALPESLIHQSTLNNWLSIGSDMWTQGPWADDPALGQKMLCRFFVTVVREEFDPDIVLSTFREMLTWLESLPSQAATATTA